MYKAFQRIAIVAGFLCITASVLADGKVINAESQLSDIYPSHPNGVTSVQHRPDVLRVVPALSAEKNGDDAIFHPMKHLFSGPEDIQRHDLEHESIIKFWYKILSENTIDVAFQAGDQKCYGHRAVLLKKENAIEIAIVKGGIPGSPDFCTLVGRSGHFVLHTKNPIGNRKIIPLDHVELKR